MGESPAKKDHSRLQVICLVVLLILLVVTSVTTALMATGVIKVSEKSGSIASMTDAQLLCDQELRKDYGVAMNSFVVDDRSSHFDNNTGKFKMFYEMEVYRDASQQTGTKIFFVNCFVSGKRGTITRMDYLEQKDFVPKAGRRTHGNPFGL